MTLLKGIVPIIPAPFTQDGISIDEIGLRNVVEAVINEGVNGIGLFGLGTEFYKLSEDERDFMLKTVVDQCSGRVPVVVSVTNHATVLAVKEAKKVEAAGADIINIFPPHFLSPSGDAILHHIREIAENVNLPIIIQYAPNVTGVGIAVETFLEIERERSQPVYVKAESTPPGQLISSLIEHSDGRMGVFIGNGGVQAIDAFERGAFGIMPGTAMAKAFVSVYKEFTEGSREKAIELFNILLPLLNITTQSAEMFVKFEKILLVKRGIFSNDHCRAPGYKPDNQYEDIFHRYCEEVQEKLGFTF